MYRGISWLELELGGVEEESHQHTTEGAGNGNGHDPREEKKTDSLEVDSLEGAVAETNANSGAGDAHGGGNGEGELRKDKHGDGGAHLHGAASAGGVVGDLVTHNCRALVSGGANGVLWRITFTYPS